MLMFWVTVLIGIVFFVVGIIVLAKTMTNYGQIRNRLILMSVVCILGSLAAINYNIATVIQLLSQSP